MMSSLRNLPGQLARGALGWLWHQRGRMGRSLRFLALATLWCSLVLAKGLGRYLWRGIDVVSDLRVLTLIVALVAVASEFRPQSTTDALVHVVWTEARGESRVGQQAIIWNVYNRLKANKAYWGTGSIQAVVYSRRGKNGERCDYDGICEMPSMRTVRFTPEWWNMAFLVIETRLEIALGFPDPTGGAHSYATIPVYLESGYHLKLCHAVIIGRHIFGTDPETGSCRESAAPEYVSKLPPARPINS